MLARPYRLRRAADLAKVYKFGKSSQGAGFYIKYRQTHLPVTRVAIVVTKKVSKKATLRNRFKRQVSEVVRTNWQLVKPGFDLIIMVTKDLSDLSSTKLQLEILGSMKRASVIEAKN